MDRYEKIGNNPVPILGAGFTLGVLKEPPFSTKNIIIKTIESHDKGWFPILTYLYEQVSHELLTLNNVWKLTKYYSAMIRDKRYEIYDQYKLLKRDVLINYFHERVNAEDFIETMLGIELKRIISLHMTSEKMDGEKNNLSDVIEFLLKWNKSSQIAWVSLNYDTCLEQLLDSYNGSWVYPFEYKSGKHIVIKPHGSLNMSFETYWETFEHRLMFYNLKDRYKTFDEREVGISYIENRVCEKRPWLVGYLPDYLKHELRTSVEDSDIAHDLCRLNIGAFSMVLQKATSLFILGYSLPKEDGWVWSKIRMLTKRDLPIFILSKKDSPRIKNQFKSYGFCNAAIWNKGEISG